jgi:hypothetical protein
MTPCSKNATNDKKRQLKISHLSSALPTFLLAQRLNLYASWQSMEKRLDWMEYKQKSYNVA